MAVKRYRKFIPDVSLHIDAWRTCAYLVYMTQQSHAPGQAVPPVTLGWRIQLALDFAELKYDALMSKFEVSRQTVSRWCRDVGTPPKKFILNEIAVMCEVSPRWLIDGVPPAGYHPPEALLGSQQGSRGDTPEQSGAIQAVDIPQLARVLIVDQDGNVLEEVARGDRLSTPVTLRLTAECNLPIVLRGTVYSTIPHDLELAA